MEFPPAAHVNGPLSETGSVEMEQMNQEPTQARVSSKKPSWWKRHIAPDVPFETCRDHYALERTYLSWLRTSVKFAHFGVVVAQLFRLPKDLLPSSPIISEFYRLGKPMGLVSIVLAMLVIATGGFRCWQQQRFILDGKIRSCGWEIWLVVILTLAYVIVILVFVAGDAASGKPV